MTSAIDRLARRLRRVELGLLDLSASPQLARSSIVDGSIDQVEVVDTGRVDEFGNPVFEERVVARFGAQEDGGNTTVTFVDPTPGAPSMPSVTPGPGFMVVAWDGLMADGTAPSSYVRAVGVYVGTATESIPAAETLRGEILPGPGGGEFVVGSLPAGDYRVSLAAVSHGGNVGDATAYRVGGPGTSASYVQIAEALAKAEAAQEAAGLAVNAATEADKRAAEARALADAVSAAANRTDNRAIDALRRADVSILSADGRSTITYSLAPPGTAPGGPGDTWYQLDDMGVVIGLWECTDGAAVDPVVPEPTPVTPPAPTFENWPGTARDSYTIPARVGVTYLVDGATKPAGTYTDREGAVAVAATPEPGYVFPATARTVWAGTLSTDGTGTRDPVSVNAPVFVDVDGPDDTVELYPPVPAEGATWHLNGSAVAAGVHPASGLVHVEAVPGEYFTLGTAQAVWEHQFDPNWHIEPAPPTFLDRAGTASDVYTIPSSPGVVYQVAGVNKTPGEYPGGGSVTVDAVPLPGWAFVDGAPSSWTHVFSAEVPPAPV